MKLKNILFILGAGIGLTIPLTSALAGGSCQRCEEALYECRHVQGNSADYCEDVLMNMGCRLC